MVHRRFNKDLHLEKSQAHQENDSNARALHGQTLGICNDFNAIEFGLYPWLSGRNWSLTFLGREDSPPFRLASLAAENAVLLFTRLQDSAPTGVNVPWSQTLASVSARCARRRWPFSIRLGIQRHRPSTSQLALLIALKTRPSSPWRFQCQKEVGLENFSLHAPCGVSSALALRFATRREKSLRFVV